MAAAAVPSESEADLELKSVKCNHMRPRPIEAANTGTTELWAKRVVNYSSQYNSTTWAANTILGSPQVYPRYGDIHGAWAQQQCDANQYIEIEYADRLYISEIQIYETLNAGAVTRVAATNGGGQWMTLWQADNGPTVIQSSRIFTPDLEIEDFHSNRLRLELNCTAAGSWCEIDAVKMKGRTMLLDGPPPLTTLSDNLYTLVNNPEFADCQFLVENEPKSSNVVYGHRAILASRSEYFRAMFSSTMREKDDPSKPILMPDISEKAFLGMMQFIYTNQIDKTISPLELVEIVRVADRFQLIGLQQLGQYYLADEISVENVIPIYRECSEKLPVLEVLQKTCLRFISSHMEEVSRTKDFCALPQSVLLEIVQDAATRMRIK